MRRNIGKSGIKVFPIGIGTGFSNDELRDSDKIVDAIRFGIDRGLQFIDTAENYGGGMCEELVGRAIAGRREQVVIAGKFSPEHSSFDKVIAACERSLRRLKTDYIDLYQTHWPNPSVPWEETLRALLHLKKQGKVRALGMSNFSVKELRPPFVSLQTEYNLFERTVEYNGTLAHCQKNNIALIAYSPLDQGRINSKKLAFLSALAKKYQKTVSQVLLAWLIARKPVIVIPKSVNTRHIRENKEATEFILEHGDIKRIDKEFFQKIVYISTDAISVSGKGERDRQVYQTLDEAIENKFGYTPSPAELARSLKSGGFVKPVRLIPASGGRYELINGRIRYWAWVIAFDGKKPIPAHVRRDLK